MKSSEWYGPFKMDDEDWFYFQSVTEDGKFDGIRLNVYFDDKVISVSYSTHANHDSGVTQSFKNF